MFQWSNNSNNNNSTTTNRMRGQRPSTTIVTAQSIQGTTIRAPESSYTHAQHLDSYLQDETLKRSTRVVPPGNETFDTVFQSIHGDTFLLRTHFGESNVPHMSLAGMQVSHDWLDSNSVLTGYPPIQSAAAWRDTRLLLGQAVHQVVQELQVRPPIIHCITDPALERIQRNRNQQPPVTRVEEDAPPTYSSVIITDTTTVDMPVVPAEFPELDALDREQLDALLSNDVEFQTFCHKLNAIRSLNQMATAAVDENAMAAQRNLQKKDPLIELHQTATSLQEQFQQKVQEFRQLEQTQDSLCQPVDRRKVVKEFTKAKKEALEESEQLATDWIENQEGAHVDQFLSSFLQVRQLHHVRAAKLELLEASR